MQLFELAQGMRLLVSESPDVWLTNGEAYSQTVWLGCEDDPENWSEVSQEEYEVRGNLS